MALLQLIAILWGPYLIVGTWIVIKQLIERR
jgi:hypothetical protein